MCSTRKPRLFCPTRLPQGFKNIYSFANLFPYLTPVNRYHFLIVLYTFMSGSPFFLLGHSVILLYPLSSDIKMHILITDLYTFLMQGVRRFCLNIKTSYRQLSLPLLLSLEYSNKQWSCKDKFHFHRGLGLNGLRKVHRRGLVAGTGCSCWSPVVLTRWD